MPMVEQTMMIIGMMKRHRVSSHALYQSMSVLRHAFEKDLLQRHRYHGDRRRMEPLRFGENAVAAAARQYREHAALALDANHARRVKGRVRRILFEHQLH